MKDKKRTLAFFVLFTLILSGCSRQNIAKKTRTQKTSYLLGTVIRAEVYGANGEEALNLAFQRVKEIEKKMSRYIADSEISLINQNAGKKAVPISEDTFFVLEAALEYADKTNGAFNPVIGNIVELWGIGTEDARIPTEEEINLLLPLDYKQLVLTKEPYTAQLMSDKVKVDLGAIAKGYAGDEMASILSQQGISSALLNLGGNVVVIGKKPDDTLWSIGIQDPTESDRGEIAGIIKAKNTSVVTSGSYERFFEKDKVRYHHIMDPATGYPGENGIISSTIITQNSMTADALSTAVYILGKDSSLSLIESLPHVEAILITDDHKVYTTSGVKNDDFILKSEAFKYEKS